MNEETKLATIPFWKHEYEMWKHRKREKKLAIALMITSILLIIVGKKR